MNVGDVAVDGVLAERQPFGDRAIAEAVSDEAEHLELAGGERAGSAARVEGREDGARRAGLVLGGLRAPERAQGLAEPEPGPGGLQRRTGRRELLGRVVVAIARGRMLARRGGGDALGEARRGQQRRGADRVRDRAQLPRVPGRGGVVARRRLRPHQRLERAGARGRVAGRDAAEHPLEARASQVRLAAGEAYLRAPELGERVALGLGEQRQSVVVAALAAPQFAEAHDGVRAPRGPRRRQLLERGDQHPLRLVPLAAPGEHGAVVGLAHPRHEADVEAAAERLDLPAPLGGALEVAHPLAGGDQVAAGPACGAQVLVLAPERRGGGLVEAAHARGDLAVRHQRGALGRDREHLEVDGAEPPAQFARLAREPLRQRRVALAERGVRLEDGEPAVLGDRLEVFQQPRGPLRPASGDGVLAAELEVVVAEPECEPRRAAQVAGLAVAAVRALAQVEAGLDVVDPPGGPAEPLDRLGRLVARRRSTRAPPPTLPWRGRPGRR